MSIWQARASLNVRSADGCCAGIQCLLALPFLAPALALALALAGATTPARINRNLDLEGKWSRLSSARDFRTQISTHGVVVYMLSFCFRENTVADRPASGRNIES